MSWPSLADQDRTYEIFYDPATGNEGNPIVTDELAVTYTGLTPGEIYTFTLHVMDANNNRNRYATATVVLRMYFIKKQKTIISFNFSSKLLVI